MGVVICNCNVCNNPFTSKDADANVCRKCTLHAAKISREENEEALRKLAK
jgi:hypothetical protein